MITCLTGILAEISPPQITLDVHGVGYELLAPMSTIYPLPALGTSMKLLTHLMIREDGHTLYGFLTAPERTAFRSLIKVNGIGARTALSILSGLSVQDLNQAVQQQSTHALIQIPGIGKKTAERLLLELKDKLLAPLELNPASPNASHAQHDILQALIALGYHEKEALRAIDSLPPELSTTEGIRQSLRYLSKLG